MKQLLLLMIVSSLIAGCSGEPDRVKPRIGNITESVYASVSIQPDSLYKVHAAVGGIVEKIYVREGDTLKENDPIIQIRNNTPELNVENARLSLELAEKEYRGNAAILKKIRDDIEVARLNLRQDSIDFIRQQRLWENKIGTENEFDRKKLAYEISRKTLERLRNEYIRTSLQLETQMKQAQNTYQTTLVNANDYLITSNINGKIYAIYKEPGESVSFQEPVATIGSSNRFIMEMLVDEVDIAEVKSGQEVLITLDAYGQQVFHGTVTRILPQKDERTQTFTVEAVFDEQPERLYAGLSGEANIIINRRESTLIIPRRYLMEGSRVRTSDDMIEVETGLQSIEEVEILSGLDTATYILNPE